MMPNIQLARFAPGLKLREMRPGALDRRLHEVVGVVLVARQRAREAAQPRQQLDDAFTDFLRRVSHAFMLDNTSGEVIFFRAHARAFIFAALARAVRVGAAVPQVQLPQLPVPRAAARCCRTSRAASAARCASSRGARALRAERLLSEHRAELDRDPRGELVVRAEVVAIDITEAALAQRA